MTKQQQDEPKTDSRGDEIDMSAHIPKGTEDAMDADNEDRNMDAKMGDELGEGLHTASATFGTVVSDHATDAVGHTPEDIAAQAEARGVKTGGTSGKGKKDSGDLPDPGEVVGARKGLEQDDKDENEDKSGGKTTRTSPKKK